MAPKPKITLSKEELESLYVELGSKVKVGKHLNVSPCTVMNYLRKFGIKMKSRPAKKFFATKTELQEKYDELGGMLSVARHYDVSKKLIMRYMNKYEISRSDDRKRADRIISSNGYVLIYMPSNTSSEASGYIREHRLVMENYLGFKLDPNYVVHHDDEDKTNNDISNLFYMTNSEHCSLHRKREKKRREEENT